MDPATTTRQLLKVLVKWRRIVIFNTGCLALLGVVVSLVIPKQYLATASLLPPVQEAGMLGAGSALSSALGQFGGLARMAGVAGPTATSDLLARILESRAVRERVIRDCSLLDLYGVSSTDKALKTLGGQTTIGVSLEGVVTVSVEMKSAAKAAEVANSYVRNLDLVNRLNSTGRGRATRIFVEKRLREVEVGLVAAEESLRAFQEKHKTVSIEDEIVEAIRAAAQIKAEIVAREVSVGVLNQFATADNPSVRRLRNEIGQLRKQLNLMESGSGDERANPGRGFGVGFSVPFAEVPEVGMELARLTREVEIQNAVYTLLTQEHEQAKIAEVRDTPTVQVLDRAEPPERKSAPKRTRIVALGLILGIIVGVSVAFFCDKVEQIREDPHESKDWAEMMRQLISSFEWLNTSLRRNR